jgi:hypothetical protein
MEQTLRFHSREILPPMAEAVDYARPDGTRRGGREAQPCLTRLWNPNDSGEVSGVGDRICVVFAPGHHLVTRVDGGSPLGGTTLYRDSTREGQAVSSVRGGMSLGTTSFQGFVPTGPTTAA